MSAAALAADALRRLLDRVGRPDLVPADLEALELEELAAETRKLLELIGDQGNCRSCGAAGYWVRHRPSGASCLYLVDGRPHFATCPHAKQWRRGARRREPPA